MISLEKFSNLYEIPFKIYIRHIDELAFLLPFFLICFFKLLGNALQKIGLFVMFVRSSSYISTIFMVDFIPSACVGKI